MQQRPVRQGVSPLLRAILVGAACFLAGCALTYWYMNLALQSSWAYENTLLGKIDRLEAAQEGSQK